MSDYGRRIVIDLPFIHAVPATIHALQAEGFDVVSRVNLRSYCRDVARHDLRHYEIIQALPTRLTVPALLEDLSVGTVLPATIAVYELADGETAVVAAEPFAGMLEDGAWRHAVPALAALADQESDALARALARLQVAARLTEVTA